MSLLSTWAAQALAIISATAASGAFVAAVGTWLQVRRNSRTLYGEEEIEHDDGLVGQVRENEQRSKQNESALEDEDILKL